MMYLTMFIVGSVLLFLLWNLIPSMPSHTHRNVAKVDTYTSDSSTESIEEEHALRERRRKAQIMQSEFEELMSYDVQTAYKGKGDK